METEKAYQPISPYEGFIEHWLEKFIELHQKFRGSVDREEKAELLDEIEYAISLYKRELGSENEWRLKNFGSGVDLLECDINMGERK